MEHANFYCQCEKCWNSKKGVVQYRPQIIDGVVKFKCPACGSITMQIILGGDK